MQMIDDPLVRAMMPIPKQGAGAFYVDDPEGRLVEILILLSKLSSPILRVVNPAWAIRADHVINELQNTNIQPFVVSELTAKDSPMVNTIGQACTYAPRTVVLAGQPDVVVPPSVKRITTELDTEKFDYQTLLATPWEALGATVVKKWMRKEWPPTEARSGRKAAHR
ncbi:hypothetical protein [Kiloniella sp.]|uniref:hypothetical protein n=1 Tax=Kiloniella sp. TaxID=1938587 RepID=UPI003B0160D6